MTLGKTMAIADEKLKHGFVISQILLEISKNDGSRISIVEGAGRSSYVISVYNKGRQAGKFGLFIKFSSKRNSPWRYSFHFDHQKEIRALQHKYGQVFVALVNKDDGVSCLSYDLLKQLLDENFDDVETITVNSKLRTQYSLVGTDGKLDKKIARNDFPKSIGLYAGYLVKSLGTKNHTKAERGIWKRLFGTN